ncbi:MAG: LPXTG cell wall anchor domain-containing protein [Anaerolineales bacterium]|nr:LPXTG cell wall anchor domain-containing protein [Anaerolineales bacterium]
MFDGNDEMNYDEEPLPEESSNRTFIMVAGGMGALMLLVLACIVIYMFVIKPGQTATQLSQQDQQATLDAQNLQINQALTATAQAQPLASATVTITPSQTPVVAQPTDTPIPPTDDPATATVAALQTQVAQSTQTIVFTTTALPNTGLADDIGIPGIVGILVVLVAVILITRRLRTSPAN